MAVSLIHRRDARASTRPRLPFSRQTSCRPDEHVAISCQDQSGAAADGKCLRGPSFWEANYSGGADLPDSSLDRRKLDFTFGHPKGVIDRYLMYPSVYPRLHGRPQNEWIFEGVGPGRSACGDRKRRSAGDVL